MARTCNLLYGESAGDYFAKMTVRPAICSKCIPPKITFSHSAIRNLLPLGLLKQPLKNNVLSVTSMHSSDLSLISVPDALHTIR